MVYTVYQTATGKILRYVTADPEMLAKQLREGEGAAEGRALPNSRVDLETGNFVALGEQPGPYYEFDYSALEWVDARTQEEVYNQAADQVRSQRAALLTASDWTQIPDVPLPTKEAWAVYRQTLRDITEQAGYPYEVVWPVAPQ